MTLRTVLVLDPPAGVDWQTIVPGQYLYDITGITATLTTGVQSNVTCFDASPHGNDGTFFDFGGPFPPYVPGLVAGDLALEWQATSPVAEAEIDTPANVCDWRNPFSFVWWSQALVDTPQQAWFYQAFSTITSSALDVVIQPNGLTNHNLQLSSNVGFPGASNTFPNINDGLPHMFGVGWDGANALYTLDGVDIGVVTPTTPGSPASILTNARIGAFGPCSNIIDEWSIFPYFLTAAQHAAIFAAGAAGFATYSALILSLLPQEYYHFDGGTPSTGRQTALAVTNSIDTVEFLPPGFDDITTPGPYRYSWQPNLASSTQTPDGTLTTVAIPRLILPAGYTVGTDTVDIQPTDQWSNVTVWWDDAVMSSLNPFNPYAYPPGATLVSPYLKVGP